MSAKGTTWKKGHGYITRIMMDGRYRYFYTQEEIDAAVKDYEDRQGSSDESNSAISSTLDSHNRTKEKDTKEAKGSESSGKKGSSGKKSSSKKSTTDTSDNVEELDDLKNAYEKYRNESDARADTYETKIVSWIKKYASKNPDNSITRMLNELDAANALVKSAKGDATKTANAQKEKSKAMSAVISWVNSHINSKSAKHADEDGTELMHSGVLGMKWGVRRFQKKDGSLTDDGRRHAQELARERARAERTDLKWANKNETRIRKSLSKATAREMSEYDRKVLRPEYGKGRNKDGSINKAYANAYSKKLAELYTTAAKDLRTPSGAAIKFVAARGTKDVMMAITDPSYNIGKSAFKNGVYASGKAAYRNQYADMKTYETKSKRKR